MSTPISLDKKYRYKNGQPARILTTTRTDKYQQYECPVLSESADGRTFFHHSDGKSFYTDAFDLVEIREPREFRAVIIRDGGTLASYDVGDENRDEYEVIRVREVIEGGDTQPANGGGA